MRINIFSQFFLIVCLVLLQLSCGPKTQTEQGSNNISSDEQLEPIKSDSPKTLDAGSSSQPPNTPLKPSSTPLSSPTSKTKRPNHELNLLPRTSTLSTVDNPKALPTVEPDIQEAFPSDKVAQIRKSLEFVLNSADFVEIVETPHLVLDLRYASTNNFTKKNIYGKFDRAFLHQIAARKLKFAESILARDYPHLRFVLYDALRPRSVQQILWEQFTPPPGQTKSNYVANPKRGSLHNYGLALDISIRDRNDQELDMGTPFDSFERLAQPAAEMEMLASRKLTSQQYSNRIILRKIMTTAGFKVQSTEWWHFNALSKDELKKHNLKIVE